MMPLRIVRPEPAGLRCTIRRSSSIAGREV